MTLIHNWCKGEGVDPNHAIVVHHVPEDLDAETIEETLNTIKRLGCVKVKGRIFDPQTMGLMVLCPCSVRVDTTAIPMRVMPVNGGASWYT